MIVKLKETPSTNTYAQSILQCSEPENGTLYWAEAQTAGRGQKGNSWESEAGKNISCSIVLYPNISIAEQFIISKAVSVAVADFLSEFTDGISIKWPNDIYWREKKIAGILIEQNLYGKEISSCVAGIGININQEIFRSNAPNPVSLKNITGETYDIPLLIEKLHKQLMRFFSQLHEPMLHDLYAAKLFRKSGYYDFADNEGKFVAKIHHIENDGHLVLQTNNGELCRYAFKEVEFIL